MERVCDGVTADQIGRDLWLVAVSGEQDAATAPRIEELVRRVRRDGADLVIDLSEATFIDSSIAGILVRHALPADGAQSPGVAVVLASGGFPDRVLRVLGLEQMLPAHRTRQEAQRALGR